MRKFFDLDFPQFRFKRGARRPRTASRDVLVALDYWTRRWSGVTGGAALKQVADAWIVGPETVKRAKRLHRAQCELALKLNLRNPNYTRGDVVAGYARVLADKNTLYLFGVKGWETESNEGRVKVQLREYAKQARETHGTD